MATAVKISRRPAEFTSHNAKLYVDGVLQKPSQYIVEAQGDKHQVFLCESTNGKTFAVLISPEAPKPVVFELEPCAVTCFMRRSKATVVGWMLNALSKNNKLVKA